MRLEKQDAIDRIERNRGRVGTQTIRCESPGIKVLAAIDCLCHYHGYTWAHKPAVDATPFWMPQR